jgi:hypothetical protein
VRDVGGRTGIELDCVPVKVGLLHGLSDHRTGVSFAQLFGYAIQPTSGPRRFGQCLLDHDCPTDVDRAHHKKQKERKDHSNFDRCEPPSATAKRERVQCGDEI